MRGPILRPNPLARRRAAAQAAVDAAVANLHAAEQTEKAARAQVSRMRDALAEAKRQRDGVNTRIRQK